MPNLCVGIGVVSPLLAYTIIRSLPVKAVESDVTKSDKLPRDNYMLKTGTVTIVLIVLTILLCCLYFGSSFSTQVTSTRVETLALKKQRKVKNT